MANSSISFQNLSPPNFNYFWEFGDGNISTEHSPNHTYNKAGIYYVKLSVSNDNKCKDTTLLGPYEVKNENTFYFPNAFSPNGDNLNDKFQLIGEHPQNLEIEIYDRFGNRIFNKKGDHLIAWDGKTNENKPCPEGIYIYKITAQFQNQKTIQQTATITLIR